jgi:L-ascorbate metabolism protein UlaG (beta-lactamase superfamily)
MMSVQLEFVGHACFRLWQDGLPAIVMDPYRHATVRLEDDGTQLESHTVIVSSRTDPAHDNVEFVAGNPHVIDALDVARGQSNVVINGEPLITVEAAEALDHTLHSPNDNALYAFKADDLWILHMGDLGYELTPEQLAPFVDHCDVFLVITGEANTPSHDELDRMIDFLCPKWVVPMHYNLPPITFDMSTIEKFLEHRAQDPIIRVRHHTVALPLPMVKPGHPAIVVLEPSGYTPTT